MNSTDARSLLIDVERISTQLEQAARRGGLEAPDAIGKIRLDLAMATTRYLSAVKEQFCDPLMQQGPEGRALVTEYMVRARDSRRIVAAHQMSWTAARTKADWAGYCKAIIEFSTLFAERRLWELHSFIPAAQRLLTHGPWEHGQATHSGLEKICEPRP
jgi:hypothetical protein